MKKVRMLRIMAGPTGVAHPGDVIELSNKDADQFIKQGHGELVGVVEEVAEVALDKDIETRETTDAPPLKRPRRKKEDS